MSQILTAARAYKTKKSQAFCRLEMRKLALALADNNRIPNIFRATSTSNPVYSQHIDYTNGAFTEI
jgi:hypothetical protein